MSWSTCWCWFISNIVFAKCDTNKYGNSVIDGVFGLGMKFMVIEYVYVEPWNRFLISKRKWGLTQG